MGQYIAADNAATTLAASISNSPGVTSLILADASRFPVVNQGGSGSDWSYLTLFDSANNMETVKITRRDSGSNTLSILRGTAAGITGTTDASCLAWSSGTTGVAVRLVSQVVLDISAQAAAAALSASQAASSASASASSAAAAASAVTSLNPSDIAYKSGNLAGLANAASARQNLGLGNGGAVNTAGNAVVLDANGKLPSFDGSQLTGLAQVPAGAVAYFAMATAPGGWLKANGAAVSRTTYATLFAAIGTTFGAGDGATTFNLPDLRGEFIRGFDDGRGIDTGRVMGTAQAGTRFPAIEVNSSSTLMYVQSSVLSGDEETTTIAARAYQTVTTGDSDVVKQYFKARPRNVALLACIKV